MSFALRRAAQRAVARIGSQHQQKRLAGDLPVKTNKWIEEAGARRENIEREFRWDGRTLTNIAVFAGLVPYMIYTFAVKEFNEVDTRAGRPKRDMWGSTD